MTKHIDQKLDDLKTLKANTERLWAQLNFSDNTEVLLDNLNNYMKSCYELLDYSQSFYSRDVKFHIMATSTIETISEYVSNPERFTFVLIDTLQYNYGCLSNLIADIEYLEQTEVLQ